MNNRTYAKEITKDYLKSVGIEDVSLDGRTIIVKGKPATIVRTYSGKRPYDNVQFYDTDLRMAIPKEERTTASGQFRIGVHIIVYCWHIGTKKAGYVVDHIDNNSLNNHVDNLQLLTPRENVLKDNNKPQRVVKMPKYITEDEIVQKIVGFEAAYEQAKADHDANAAHLLRNKLSLWRAKHRQFLEDPEKYTKPEKKSIEHDCHARAEKRRILQANIDSARKYYKEIEAAYGKDDPYVKQLWGEWKMAIAELYAFKEECKKAKEAETIC